MKPIRQDVINLGFSKSKLIDVISFLNEEALIKEKQNRTIGLENKRY